MSAAFKRSVVVVVIDEKRREKKRAGGETGKIQRDDSTNSVVAPSWIFFTDGSLIPI